jgi:CheY-like chemotaxis protein
MRSGRSVKTVLVLDSDVGFAFWCGHALSGAGYLAVAALSVPEAVALIGRLHLKLDAVIVDPTMSEAKEFVGYLRDSRSSVRVVAAIEALEELEGWALGIEGLIFKPAVANDHEALGWLTVLNSVLSDVPVPF